MTFIDTLLPFFFFSKNFGLFVLSMNIYYFFRRKGENEYVMFPTKRKISFFRSLNITIITNRKKRVWGRLKIDTKAKKIAVRKSGRGTI